MEALVNLETYKQYPTLAGIYLRIVYNTTSDERTCLPCFIWNLPDFQFRLKSETLSSKYVCLLPDSTKLENVFYIRGVLDFKFPPNIPENQYWQENTL